MRTKAKLFITSLLMMIVTSMAGYASSAGNTQAVVSSKTADRQMTATTADYARAHSQDNPAYSDGEMCFTSLLEAFVQSNQFRARRVAHYSVLFKTAMYKLCLQHKRTEQMFKCKATDAYTPVRNLQTCSDYYIFALRRILI